MTIDQILAIVTPYIFNIIITVLVLFVGFKAIKIVDNLLIKFLDKTNLEPSVRGFMANLLNISLKGFIILIAVGTLGVEMTSLIALLGGIGVAIGMSLSGTLQNFASGIIILVFKPFKVGDFIEISNFSGTVNEIQIFNTLLTTYDGKALVIPNSQLSSQTLINFSTMPTRMIDWTVGISYADDLKKAKDLIWDIVKKDTRFIKELNNQVVVGGLGDSSVNIRMRLWVNTSDYWLTLFDLMESVKLSFDSNGITIPFPQRVVTLNNKENKIHN